ncbi:protein LTV1 homolog [Saccostrea echinata]|uniref:protein LTV1 homolog n=1 Tax=Saccostrea echinata TaxID=191078 RepID=UPI002A82AA8D|nr:protein LTV1 homolog [Saccostrea echinata]
MPAKSKKFIDKKNAVTFHLVHRSQRDPLQAKEESSKHVLLPVEKKELSQEEKQEEQHKYGIFYDDDYDYLQHLKDLNQVYELEEAVPREEKNAKISLPSSVFASDLEKDVGLLNEAVPVRGPRPDWDPDIVAALDEDFDYDDPENQLEDDFIAIANAGEGPECNEDGDYEGEVGSDVDFGSDECEMSDDDFGSDDRGKMFMEEETKSRFTNYSMSSSVIRRNEGLTLLDDRFEKLYEQYEDTEIGALDNEDVDGYVEQGSHMLDTILEDFEKQQEENRRNLHSMMDDERPDDLGIEVKSEEESDNEADLVHMVIEKPKEKWDCESIISTYSNLYNHPKLIEEPKKDNKIKLTSRLKIPEGVLEQPGLTRKRIEQEMRDSRRADKASTYRPPKETTEERKQRKQAVKLERMERRMEKKANKQAFSEEKVRQTKEKLNLQKNLQGLKLS